jgi:hypothetical protein
MSRTRSSRAAARRQDPRAPPQPWHQLACGPKRAHSDDLPLPTPEKQRLLKADDIPARFERLIEVLSFLLAERRAREVPNSGALHRMAHLVEISRNSSEKSETVRFKQIEESVERRIAKFEQGAKPPQNWARSTWIRIALPKANSGFPSGEATLHAIPESVGRFLGIGGGGRCEVAAPVLYSAPRRSAMVGDPA